MSKQGLTGLFVALGLALANAGCGEDDSGNNMMTTNFPSTGGDGGQASNNGGGQANNGGGQTNNGGQANNNGGGQANNGGGQTNNGGQANNGGVSFPDLSCDDTVPTTATCGGMECPTPTGAGSPLCIVPCCVDDQCGTRSANSLMPTECRVSAQGDDRCPPYQGNFMGMAVNLAGCCMPEGVCGVISSLSQSCITQSPILTDLPANPPPCDGASSGSDAGTSTDAGT